MYNIILSCEQIIMRAISCVYVIVSFLFLSILLSQSSFEMTLFQLILSLQWLYAWQMAQNMLVICSCSEFIKWIKKSTHTHTHIIYSWNINDNMTGVAYGRTHMPKSKIKKKKNLALIASSVRCSRDILCDICVFSILFQCHFNWCLWQLENCFYGYRDRSLIRWCTW